MNIRLTIITILAVCTALWAMPGVAHGQNQGSNLLLTANGTGGNYGGLILQYTSSGAQSTFAPNVARPRGVGFDSKGNLFVLTNFYDGSDNCCQGVILKITPDGTQSTFANPSGYLFLQGLATDKADNVFVSVQDDESPTLVANIYKFTPSGVQTTFGSFPGQLSA
jgi:hypothetical protein